MVYISKLSVSNKQTDHKISQKKCGISVKEKIDGSEDNQMGRNLGWYIVP